MALYLVFRAAALIARRMPLRVSYALARLTGLAAFYLWAGGRRRCIANMMRVTGGDVRQASRLARRSFGNYLVYLVDFFRFLETDAPAIRKKVHFADWDRLAEARQGQGVVVITMHFGNWDLGAAILALAGFPVAAIADSFANPRVNRLVRGSREHLGMRIIPAERMGPGILRSLRSNDTVAMLIDVPTPEGVHVEFFGETISVSDGPARIALRAGASVVAATVRRVLPWSDRVSADIAPVRFEATGDQEHDVRALTQAVFRELERLVRSDPSQWYIFRSLWVADMPSALQNQPAV